MSYSLQGSSYLFVLSDNFLLYPAFDDVINAFYPPTSLHVRSYLTIDSDETATRFGNYSNIAEHLPL